MWNRILSYLKKNRVVIFILALIFVLKLPYCFDPAWYPDEGIYASIAHGLNHGQLLYADIWDNKTPMIYYFYALLFKTFGTSMFIIRFASLLFAMGAGYYFFKIFRELFPKKKVLIPAIIFALLIATWLIEGNIANAENFFILLTLSGLYYFVKFIKFKNPALLIFSGFLYGLGFTFKIHPAFEFAATGLFLIMLLFFHEDIKKFTFKKKVLTLFSYGISFIIPITFFVILFFIQGNLSDFINIFHSQATGYINTDGGKNILLNLLLSLLPRSILLIVITLGILSYIILSKKKHKIFTAPYPTLLFLIFTFALFAVLLSGKTYVHYLIEISGISIFILTYLFYQIFTNSDSLKKSRRYFIGCFSTFIILLIAFSYYQDKVFIPKPSNGKDDLYYLKLNFSYYPNFYKLVTGEINKANYYAKFDGKQLELAEIVDATKNLRGKQVFLADDIPWFYAIADVNDPLKYTTVSHFYIDNANITDLDEQLSKYAEYIVVANYRKEYVPQEMWDYIHKNFVKVSSTQNYDILKSIFIL